MYVNLNVKISKYASAALKDNVILTLLGRLNRTFFLLFMNSREIIQIALKCHYYFLDTIRNAYH